MKKIESKIEHWNRRWLSLGGRYVLLSFVLQSIPVYWLSLYKVTKCMLNSFRKLCFKSLWSTSRDSGAIPLVKWSNLAVSKKLGGWGFKNLHMFGQPLATEQLWRSLFDPGL